MRKSITLLLMLLYLVSSTGATVTVHYCMGRPAGWSLSYHPQRHCGRCGMNSGMQNNHSCCRESQQFIKEGGDAIAPDCGLLPDLRPIALAPFNIAVVCEYRLFPIFPSQPANNAAPPGSRVALYLRDCVFLI